MLIYPPIQFLCMFRIMNAMSTFTHIQVRRCISIILAISSRPSKVTLTIFYIDAVRAIPTLRLTLSVDNRYQLHDRRGSSNSMHQHTQPSINNLRDHSISNGNNQRASVSTTNRHTAHTHHDSRIVYKVITSCLVSSS